MTSIWEGSGILAKKKQRQRKAKRTANRQKSLAIVPNQPPLLAPVTPHSSTHVWRIPVSYKTALGLIASAVLLVSGSVGSLWWQWQQEAAAAAVDRQEIQQLRQTNDGQQERITAMQAEVAELQQEMEGLRQLEGSLRDVAQETGRTVTVSRAGIERPEATYTGQGGPLMTAYNLDQISQTLTVLQGGIQERQESLTGLHEALLERKQRLATRPSIWPANGQMTSRFGYRGSPQGRGSSWHPGVDIANGYGTPIVATAAGTVFFSGWDDGGYGRAVRIDHGNGITTLYGHMSSLAVRSGEWVQKQQVIGYMGSTGISTGTHVHYEVRVNGALVDPLDFM